MAYGEKMKEYKLFNTDGKTFFDFRSNPQSRCEGFTISYLDDGTVVMSGDYGTLCWRRYGNNPDYGFPNEETGIGYFEEKVCQFGIKQEIRRFDKEKAIKYIKEYSKDYGDEEKLNKFLQEVEYLEDYNSWGFFEAIRDNFTDFESWDGVEPYTEQFIFMFKILKSVSNQIWDAVIEKRIPSEAKYGS